MIYQFLNDETEHLYQKKKNKIQFYYYTQEEFNKIQKEQNIRLLGNIYLKNEKEKNRDEEKFDYIVISEYYNFYSKIVDNDKGKLIGYIKINDNTYVRVLKKRFIIPILLSLLLLISLFILLLINKPLPNIPPETTPNLNIADGKDWNGELPTNGEGNEKNKDSIKIPGYANLYISKDKSSIQLINPDINSVYFVYTIKNGEETIFKSDAIKPNQMIEANLREKLDVGEYNLKFYIDTYDVETQSSCNGSVQDVDVTVKD